MITWKHTLNDTEVDEPQGFDTISIGPIRDEVNHGIGFEATTSSLSFTGTGFDILDQANEATGLKSKVIYSAYSMCEGEEDFTLVYSGRINFGALKKKCGIECTITAPVETSSCEIVLKSRYDQQVDVDKLTGVDNVTGLVPYSEMGKRLTLHAKKVSTGLDVQVDNNGDVTEGSIVVENVVDMMYRPNYEVVRLNSINTGHPDSQSYFIRENDVLALPISPQLFLDDFVTDCFDGGFTYNFRMKGSYRFSRAGGPNCVISEGKIKLFDWDGVTGNIFDNGTLITEVSIISSADSIPVGSYLNRTFDETLSGTYSLLDGHGLYAVVFFEVTVLAVNTANIIVGGVTFDQETIAYITAEKACPDTETDYYMIHETLSHVTEQITNGCLRVKSAFYGRTDSQPYDFPALGCGGLRMLTSGLKIRNAENATFFTSFKQLIEGLRAIDNIGFDVYGNDVRIEDVRFFYRDKEIARCPGVNEVNSSVDETRHYAKITAGYSTWKVEKINGLDEFNSEREYKTGLETISNELKIQSALVAGSYPIEVTRQQSFAATGAADTSYDNEVFIICLERAEYPYSSFVVEQGNVSDPENMYSPETAYNWRIRPVANMYRWYKSIASSYRDFMNTTSKIFFSSGTGNILAKGKMTDNYCRPELFVTQENQDILFTQTSDYTPIWINETISFNYPMSLAEYNKIKEDPYGYVSFQCGTGVWKKGFVKQIQYQPVAGMATYTLIRKYE